MQNIENKCKGILKAKNAGFGCPPDETLKNIPAINTEIKSICTTGINKNNLNFVKFIVAVSGNYGSS